MARIVTIEDNRIIRAGEEKATEGSRIDRRAYTDDASRWIEDGRKVRVKSSNVRYIWYEKPAQRLYVQFKSGDTYYYPSVTVVVAKRMFNGTSMGKYVWWMRRNGYVGIKV